MAESYRYSQRETAIHLLRSGRTPKQVATQLGRALSWVYKWRKRFGDTQDWSRLQAQSRAARSSSRRLPEAVVQAIRQTRSELEAEAVKPDHLHYIGAPAVQARLEQKGITPLPSTASIERVLRKAGMTRRKHPKEEAVVYPRLHPTAPHQLCQVDILPQYLTGGQSVACFEAIDVVSRYPMGQPYPSKRSADAADFLLCVWHELGIPTYTQVDNEACFSGGFTHRYVLGKVVRLGLFVGTEWVFSPHYHPESNGTVERFHQDYLDHVWRDRHLNNLEEVQQHGQQFFARYRHSRHHVALGRQSPAALHAALLACPLPTDFRLPEGRLPLTVGRVHFMRKVSQAHTISLLNVPWEVPQAQPEQGVWATLEITLHDATLRVYDTAPDAAQRTCLVEHPFPLTEPVKPLGTEFQKLPRNYSWIGLAVHTIRYILPSRALAWLSTML